MEAGFDPLDYTETFDTLTKKITSTEQSIQKGTLRNRNVLVIA